MSQQHSPGAGPEHKPPWQWFVDQGWRIVGMNHYQQGGELRLFVAMTKGRLCIQAEGKDDEYLWNRLAHQLWDLNATDQSLTTRDTK